MLDREVVEINQTRVVELMIYRRVSPWAYCRVGKK